MYTDKEIKNKFKESSLKIKELKVIITDLNKRSQKLLFNLNKKKEISKISELRKKLISGN